MPPRIEPRTPWCLNVTSKLHAEPTTSIQLNSIHCVITTMEEESSPTVKSSLRHRAEALASAFYYTECSLSGISSTNASAAEENVRSNQSKWWLHGDDPNHPAHNSVQHDVILKKSDGEEAKPAQDSFTSTEEGPDDDQGDQNDEEGSDSDWDAPIFAHDDDYSAPNSLLGSLNNFQFKRSTIKTRPASSNSPFSVSTRSTLLPTWSQGPLLDSSKSCVEEVLRSYSSYRNHYFCTSDITPLSSSPIKPHPIISESEADDSLYTSEMSLDDTGTYVSARSSATPRHTKRGHKRLKVSLDEDSTLDEAFLQAQIDRAKQDLLSSLDETTSKSFSESLRLLEKASRHDDKKEIDIDGTWNMISPPDYPSCLGINMNGDKLYTLDRMSFGMYQPGALLCSIQQEFNTISSVKNKADIPQYVPLSLKKEVYDESGKCSGRMKTYNIIASFTIEGQEADNLKGIMTNYAYTLPDPSLPRRLSIWFTGGTIEPADDDEESVRKWKKVFGTLQDESEDHPLHAEKARQLAQNILLGAVSEPMDENGVIGFHLKRPIGGHGSAFCDIVYMDDDIRVMKGHSGSVYVFKRAVFD